MSLSRDNTHSWVRISHGSSKFVMNLNNNETEIPEDQLEEYALKLSAKDFACRSKAKAKPQRREPAGSSPRIVPIEKRNWIDIEPGKHSLSDYEVSKKVIHLLRHSQKLHREEDGAVHFWRIKENLQNQLPQSIHSSDDRWKVCLAAGGGVKRRFQYCTDDSGAIVYFRTLQGHSGRNLIDPSLEDNVVIPSNFFQHIYHVGSAFNLHSIINSGLIPGGRNSKRTGRPVETNAIQTRSSEDRKDFNVEQTHERTERPVKTHDMTNVSDSSQTRSAHESETFNIENEILRKRTERSVADHDVSHESMSGHGLPNSRTTTFRCEARAEYQRSRIDSEN